ncbi:MAG: hypothetical protein H0X24_10970 [Ktedonobacterales bacterium]|nr:hypothetical protein [Ktedonobacterales bacterium]
MKLLLAPASVAALPPATPPGQAALLPLFDQQGWCWGQDVRHPEGNALLRYGFTRTARSATGSSGGTYTHISRECTVVLWSYGLWYDAGGTGVFLTRGTGAIEDTNHAPPPCTVNLRTDFPPLVPVATAPAWRAAAAACRWMADYEAWIHATFGLPYRQTVIAAWGHWLPPTVPWVRLPAETVIPRWHALAATFDHQAGAFAVPAHLPTPEGVLP